MSHMKVRCDGCAEIHTIDCDGLRWEIAETHERSKGQEKLHVATLNLKCGCGKAISIKFQCREYPVGKFDHAEQTANKGIILKNECDTCPSGGVEMTIEK